jgi:hypothetical protein
VLASVVAVAGGETVNVERDPVFGCHLFRGRLDTKGYGYHGQTRAHIAAWEAAHGTVPDGMELDHRCRRRNCTNPRHLELVTRAENERRKSWPRRARVAKCPAGHDMSVNRMVTPEGGVLCRACERGGGERA